MSTENPESLAGTAAPIDRTGWPPGPWDEEPDRLDWKTAAGPPAIALRHPSGHWCGYVGVPLDHPLLASKDDAGDWPIDVHGGVTYGSRCAGHVCHVPAPGEPAEVYWIGFDFAHAGDAAPNRFELETLGRVWKGGTAYWGEQARYVTPGDVYERAAAQCVAAARGPSDPAAPQGQP